MRTEATILHADLDSFYASVEQRDDPSLRGRPIAVGGWVVTAASYEAKALGVASGMGGAEARRRCPDLRFVPPRWDAYVQAGPPGVLAASDDSRRIMAFLAAQIPRPARAHLLAFNSVMLPEPARTVLDLPPLTPRTLRRHRRVLRTLRIAHRVLPGPLRELPPYRMAVARTEGRAPDRLTRRIGARLAGHPSRTNGKTR